MASPLLTLGQSRTFTPGFDHKAHQPILVNVADRSWSNLADVDPKQWVCGHCGNNVGGSKAFRDTQATEVNDGRAYWCPHCFELTLFVKGKQYPDVHFGKPLKYLPKGVQEHWEEARACMSVDAWAATAMLCRKIIFYVAVETEAVEEASENGWAPGFAKCVRALVDKGAITSKSAEWVNHIKDEGESATHKLPQPTKADTELVMIFTQAMLETVYELPGKLEAIRPKVEPEGNGE